METQREKPPGKTARTKGMVDEGATEGEEAQPIRVSLVMVNRLMRDTLVHVLRRREDLELAVCCGPAKDELEEIVKARSEVVLVDFVNPHWLAQLAAKGHAADGAARVIAIGMEPDQAAFLEAVRCGVRGYLLKDAGANEVVTAVRTARRGEACCSPRMCRVLFEAVAQSKPPGPINQKPNRRPGLTLRQQTLMKLVAKGLTNKEIAVQLNLSEFTVRNHVSRILKHLHAETRSAAVDTMRESRYELRL